METRLFLTLALWAAAQGFAAPAQARCTPQFHPFTGDARLTCMPDLWRNPPLHEPLRS